MKTMFFGDVSPSFDSKELFRNEEVDILRWVDNMLAFWNSEMTQVYFVHFLPQD